MAKHYARELTDERPEVRVANAGKLVTWDDRKHDWVETNDIRLQLLRSKLLGSEGPEQAAWGLRRDLRKVKRMLSGAGDHRAS